MNDYAVCLLHCGVAIAGKPAPTESGSKEGALSALFLWAPDGLSSDSPAPPLEPGAEQGITDDHQ
jgi:hypothetical protein